MADLFGLLLKDADELLADDLPLALGLSDAGQLAEVAGAGVHADKVDVKVGVAGAKDRADLLLLVLAQQAMVHKDAGQLLAHRFGQHGGQHRRIDAAGQSAQHLAAADLLAQGLDVALDKGVHLPVAGAAADVVDEVAQHLFALGGVQHLGVELDGVEALFRLFHGRHRAVDGVPRHLEAGGRLLDVVVVAHPADGGGGHPFKQLAGSVQKDLGLAVLPLGGDGHPAAEQVHHQLAAVADAQDGHPPGKDLGVTAGRILQIDAVGPAGEDDPLGVLGADDRKVGLIGIDLTVDVVLTHPARDQLVVLPAEVQYDHSFMLLHSVSSCILTELLIGIYT